MGLIGVRYPQRSFRLVGQRRWHAETVERLQRSLPADVGGTCGVGDIGQPQRRWAFGAVGQRRSHAPAVADGGWTMPAHLRGTYQLGAGDGPQRRRAFGSFGRRRRRGQVVGHAKPASVCAPSMAMKVRSWPCAGAPMAGWFCRAAGIGRSSCGRPALDSARPRLRDTAKKCWRWRSRADGRHALSGSADRTLKLWDAAQRALSAHLRGTSRRRDLGMFQRRRLLRSFRQ